ncbi:MAG TPA: phosphatidylglycerol lysyltransferase domain-containing protein [Gaiellales bacterium]|jgi:lysyl-tRNA synthetase class 2
MERSTPNARDSRTPRLAAWAAFAAGLIGIVSAATPEWHGRLSIVREYLSTSTPEVADGLVVASSLGLLVLARGLARRRHRAWQAAIVVLGISAVLHLAKGLDAEEAIFDLCVMILLLRKRESFDAVGDPGGPFRAAIAAAQALAGLVAYGLVAIAVHDAIRGLTFRPLAALHEVAWGMLGQDVHAHPGRFEHDVTLSLASATIACVIYVVWLAVRSRQPRAGASENDRRDARRLVEQEGVDSLAWFALRRDKSYFFDADRRAFIAFRAAGGFAVASGDPIGDPAAFGAVADGFLRHCHERAWRVSVLGVGPIGRDLWETRGLRTVYVGDEAIVRPADFSLEGRAIRKVRQSVTRLQKAGFTCVVLRAGELDDGRWREIEAISHAWLDGAPERGFSMAIDDMRAPEHASAVLALALDPDERVAGFVHLAPVPAAHGLSLSTMRRLPDTPNGLMEFVLCETFVWAREHDIERVSLNFAAFGELLRAEGSLCRRQRLLRFALGKADRYFQVERLLAFNRKFLPLWEPRYAAFESYSDVPIAALVTLSLESLLIWPRALRKLWPEPAT